MNINSLICSLYIEYSIARNGKMTNARNVAVHYSDFKPFQNFGTIKIHQAFWIETILVCNKPKRFIKYKKKSDRKTNYMKISKFILLINNYYIFLEKLTNPKCFKNLKCKTAFRIRQLGIHRTPEFFKQSKEQYNDLSIRFQVLRKFFNG